MSGSIKKVESAETVPCMYRGTSVECPKNDFSGGHCSSCGWNPAIEQKRIADQMGGES